MKTTNQISVSPEAVTDSMRQILAAESAAVASIPVSDEYARAVEAIVERVHRAGGKLVKPSMAISAYSGPTISCCLSRIRVRHVRLSILSVLRVRFVPT